MHPRATTETVAVIGLGYVGLPVAVAFAKKFPTIGFDISRNRLEHLREGHDATGTVAAEELAAVQLDFTDEPEDLRRATVFVVAVPTPIDQNRQPDLAALLSASDTVGQVITPDSIVCYESTVYPGVTEEVCGPVVERRAGLRAGRDFHLAYSPERINPGDTDHTFEKITKIVSAQDETALERIASLYSQVVEAGVYRAPSIKVAEAAKIIENIQRDVNIALMNELALIFDRVGIRTCDVLDAARTKWNFLPFTPGLVGGHCIGVDPYYLTTKAEELGYHPEIILAGRRINDGIGAHVARRTIKMLAEKSVPLSEARVGVLGVSFKENVPDLRNSRVLDIIYELREFGIEPLVHDPLVDPDEARREYGIELSRPEAVGDDLDALVLAVPHRFYLDKRQAELLQCVREGGVVVDVKSVLDPGSLDRGLEYWSL